LGKPNGDRPGPSPTNDSITACNLGGGKPHQNNFTLTFSTFNLQPSTLQLSSCNLGRSLGRPGNGRPYKGLQRSTFNFQRSTCNFQRSTCNLQRSTCNLQRATWPVQLIRPRRSFQNAKRAPGASERRASHQTGRLGRQMGAVCAKRLPGSCLQTLPA